MLRVNEHKCHSSIDTRTERLCFSSADDETAYVFFNFMIAKPLILFGMRIRTCEFFEFDDREFFFRLFI